MFVGRDEELRDLGAAFAKTHGSYLALAGEPGIGKTRLATEASALAEAAGYRVAWGRCWEAGGAPPLWPWIEALRVLGIVDWERAGDQFEMFDGVMRRLREVAPVALVLDDLHAADKASLLLLQFVVRQLRFARVVVIGTYRDVEARLRDDDFLPKAAREGKVFALDRLSRAEVAQLAGDRADLVDALIRSSEGNPLFVHEALQLGSDALPDGIRAVISERLRLVCADTRRALEAAAVMGFDGDIPEATRAGLVVGGRFSHARIRDVLYDELPAERRTALHVQGAERGGDPNTVAHHWFAAGQPQRAVDAAVRAADEASKRLAFDDAAALLERVAPYVADRAAHAIALGTALIRAGRHDEGQRHCVEAARGATPEVLARAALAYGMVYRFGKSDPQMVQLLEDALAALPAEDSALRAQLLGRLAGAMQPARVLSVPVEAARRAIEMARRIGDPGTLASVIVSAGSALQDVVDAAERVPNNLELVRLAVGDPLLASRAYLRCAFDQMELGNVDAADQHFRDHEAEIADHRNPRLHWPAALFRAMRADMGGRFAEADDHVAEARRLAERAGDAGAKITLAMHAVTTAIVRDNLAELAAAERLLVDHAYHPGIQQVLGAQLACRLGRIDEARARIVKPTDHPDFYVQASAGTGMAEVLGVAHPDARIYEQLLPYAERARNGVWSMTAVVSLGPIARPVSLLAAALDRWDDAERLAKSALDSCLQQGHIPVLARTRFEWGSALIKRGRAEGKALVDEARATAESIGMTALAAACKGVAAPVVAAPVARTSQAGAPVTIDRDGDVWRLRWSAEQVAVRDSRGMQMLAELVTRAGDDVHVLDLSGEGGGVVDRGDAGEMLDRTAIEKYKKRIAELSGALEDAEDRNDLGRAERLREELEALEDEVSRAVGLGGRVRRASNQVERARINVQRRIKAAVAQVDKLSPKLGAHLTRSIRTGSFCSYVPRA